MRPLSDSGALAQGGAVYGAVHSCQRTTLQQRNPLLRSVEEISVLQWGSTAGFPSPLLLRSSDLYNCIKS